MSSTKNSTYSTKSAIQHSSLIIPDWRLQISPKGEWSKGNGSLTWSKHSSGLLQLSVLLPPSPKFGKLHLCCVLWFPLNLWLSLLSDQISKEYLLLCKEKVHWLFQRLRYYKIQKLYLKLRYLVPGIIKHLQPLRNIGRWTKKIKKFFVVDFQQGHFDWKFSAIISKFLKNLMKSTWNYTSQRILKLY